VEETASGWIGHFGVNNPNAEAVDVPVGPLNRFQPAPEARGQPTSFEPGTEEELFTVEYEEAELTWQLDGIGATASVDSPRCEGPTPTPTPTPEPVTTVTTIDYEYDPLKRSNPGAQRSGLPPGRGELLLRRVLPIHLRRGGQSLDPDRA
jgi:hypothetical protein